MSTLIAVLRAVNVGGNSKLPMADLRRVTEACGFKNPRTLLQSGNLVFDAGRKTPAACEKILEIACFGKLGLKTDVYVRSAEELDAVIAHNPFAREAKDDPSHLCTVFLRDAPNAKAFLDLQAAIKGREVVKGGGRHAYITFPDGIGTSKLTLPIVEKRLGTTGTMRNWNTLLKLAALAHA